MRLFRKAKGSIPTPSLHTEPQLESTHPTDMEKQTSSSIPTDDSKTSAFSSLGWLDRFLAVWIFLTMLIGILLGNFVPSTGPALQKGKFVGVSVPIGKSLRWAFQRQGVDNAVQLSGC